MVRALIYTRVSHDRANGRSVAEQEADARSECARRGWEVLEVVTDSVGASRHSKGTRDGWGRAQRLLTGGDVDVLVTWEASRAQRDLAAYADLRDLCVRTGTQWSYSGRLFDLADSKDRFVTGLDALLAEREADETSERVRRAVRANALAGRPHGRRLYGYRRIYDIETGRLIGQEPDPVEAPVVRSIFADYLAGVSVPDIIRRLHAEGTWAPGGGQWTHPQIVRMLRRHAYAGIRVHRGEVIGDANWQPLVTREVFDRAGALHNSRRVLDIRQSHETYMLTTICRCGVCGGRVIAQRNRASRTYICKASYCVGRSQPKLDAYVTAMVLDLLAQGDVEPDPAAEHELDDARRRLTDLRAQLDDAVEEFTAGNLSAGLLARIEARIQAEVKEAERRLRPQVALAIDAPETGLHEWWKGIGSSRQREIVMALIESIVIHPVGIGRRTFDPAGVTITRRRT